MDRIDVLRSRVELLRGKDRALVQMYLDGSGSLRAMARLAGVNEANVARRLHRVIRRLLDGSYITCLRYRGLLGEQQIKIAKDYFVDGLPMRQIARRRGTSYYAVRQTLKQIQQLTAVERRAQNGNRRAERRAGK